MARDYAKYKPQPKQNLAKQKWHKKIVFFISLIFVLSLLILGTVIYKHTMFEFSRQTLVTWVTQMRHHLQHKKIEILPLAKISSTQQTQQEPEIRFNFYTELPKMQVTVPETEPTQVQRVTTKQNTLIASKEEPLLPAKELKKNKDNVENAGRYILQLGVFKNEITAGELRVSLLLAGVEVDIVQSADENKAILYRIQQGPYATLAQAKEMQKQLQKKGIMGLVKAL